MSRLKHSARISAFDARRAIRAGALHARAQKKKAAEAAFREPAAS
jgi:hypothetical protein